MRSYSYLNTAKQVIRSYDGQIPLAAWLKIFFGQEKKFGSSDRRQIAHLCYCFYRMGKAFSQTDTEERMLLALFLCSQADNLILQEQRPEWNEKIHLSLDEKIGFLSASGEAGKIFPFSTQLSHQIDANTFNRSFLVQPDLFLRIRPGRKKKVLRELGQTGIVFEMAGENSLRLSSQTKIETILDLDKDVVVQDLNSQKVFDGLTSLQFTQTGAAPTVWDCCAASGGKSILIRDLFPGAALTVSDVRESILINLKKRFQRAGIQGYQAFVADVAAADFLFGQQFDLVVCDAPCSGSGTWARTPEQLLFFQHGKISHYTGLQKKIALNAARSVKRNGCFVYITCSVFKEENEEVVAYLRENTSLQLVSLDYLVGYDKKADTLFSAVFRAL